LNTQIFTGDCLSEMQNIAASSVDMVLCDLPYGITRNAWDRVIDIPAMWTQLRRITKPDCAVVFMAAQALAADLICSNRKEFRYDLVWQKLPTGFLNASRQPLRAHETILVFYQKPPVFCPQKTFGHPPMHAKKNRTDTGKNYGATGPHSSGGSTERFPTSVLKITPVNNNYGKLHPTQKPVELMEWLIRSYTRPGATVLDFAMGSGTTGVAAVQLGRDFIGIELNPEYAAVASSRINAALPMRAAG
jgi:DNA modification methylase